MAGGVMVRRVLLQISADDGDTEAKLEKISLKADELAEKHPELKVRIDTAAASAKVAVLREELRGLSRQADEEAVKGGILSRLLTGRSGSGGLAALLGRIPLIGEQLASGLGGDTAGGASAPGGPQGLGILIGTAVASSPAWLAELDALASGFAAAGAGAGAFYLLAHPAISNLQSDVSSLSSANQALGIAQQKYLIDPTKQNAKSLHDAQVQYQAVYKQMGQDAGGAAGGVLKLHDTYVKLSTAFQPEAFKVFNGVLKLANDVLPYVTPFAKTFADSISGLLGQADKFAGSKGFKDWLGQFHSLEGPSLHAIGEGIGHILTNTGKLFTLMSSKDVANGINIAFSIVDGAIIGLLWFIKATMVAWDGLTTAWDWLERVFRRGGHDIAVVFASLRHDAADLAHNTAAHFGEIRHDIARWADDAGHDVNTVARWFGELPGRIGRALAALPGMLYQVGVGAVHGLLNGAQSMIGSVLGTVGSWGHDIANAIGGAFGIHFSEPSEATKMIKAGRNVALGLGLGIEQGTAAAHASAQRMSRAVTQGIAGQAGGGAGGAGTPRMIVEFRNVPQSMRQALKKSIRVTGGDVAVIGL